jgi:hypothetical protein
VDPFGLDCQLYTKVPAPPATFAVKVIGPFKHTGPPPETAIVGSALIMKVFCGVVALLPQASVTTAV